MISQELDIPVSLLNNPKYPTVRLRGLQPLQLYRAKVGAYNGGGVGPLSEPLIFRLGLSSSAGRSVDLKTFLLMTFISYFILLIPSEC